MNTYHVYPRSNSAAASKYVVVEADNFTIDPALTFFAETVIVAVFAEFGYFYRLSSGENSGMIAT